MTLAQLYYYTRDDSEPGTQKTPECYEWEAKFFEQAEKNERASRRNRRRKRKR